MKILVLKNKITKSLKSNLKEVKKWFYNVELDFTEEVCNFDIVNGKYSYYDQSNKLQYYNGVDETWYDENISKPAKARGFDMVILIIKPDEWVCNFVDGFGTAKPDWGIEEMVVKYYTKGVFNFIGYKLKGNKLNWIIIHELLHRIYNTKGLTDNTHKYFIERTPEKCLEDFNIVFDHPVAVLERMTTNNKQTIGIVKCINADKRFNCVSLERGTDLRIPTGEYKVTWTFSPKFLRFMYYINVKDMLGIRIHSMNYWFDSEGCVGLGDSFTDINNDGLIDITNSRNTVKSFENFFGKKEFTLLVI